jgi:hypothetical protein
VLIIEGAGLCMGARSQSEKALAQAAASLTNVGEPRRGISLAADPINSWKRGRYMPNGLALKRDPRRPLQTAPVWIHEVRRSRLTGASSIRPFTRGGLELHPVSLPPGQCRFQTERRTVSPNQVLSSEPAHASVLA